MAEITNEMIYNKLKEIEKYLKDNLTREEKLLEEEEAEIKQILQKESEELKEMKRDNGKFKFDTTVAWEAEIWQKCPEKVRKSSRDSIFYACKLTGKSCSYELCPKNEA